MTDYEILRLSEENKYLTECFTCVETDSMLAEYTSKERRRIRRHSKDMDNFLHNEAFDEQEKGLSRTYLFYVAQAVRDYSVVVFLTLDCYKHRVSYYERFGFRRNLYQLCENFCYHHL